MALSKKRDPTRRLRSFKKHGLLLLQPLATAALMTVIWRKVQMAGYHFNKEDESAVIAGITILALPYGVIAGVIIASVWEKYKKVMGCVFKKDAETFYRYRDERMPVLLHILLACLSLPMVVLICSLDYKGELCGAMIVFSVSLGITVVWVVATELEDPSKSAWFGERVPREWLEEDIDLHFKLTEKQCQNN